MGKTRLALQVAAEIQEEFRDGVYFIPLTGFSEVGDYLSTLILETMRCTVNGSLSLNQQLVSYLRSKNLLITSGRLFVSHTGRRTG